MSCSHRRGFGRGARQRLQWSFARGRGRIFLTSAWQVYPLRRAGVIREWLQYVPSVNGRTLLFRSVQKGESLLRAFRNGAVSLSSG